MKFQYFVLRNKSTAVISLLTNIGKEPGCKGILNFYLCLFILFFFQTSIISQQWVDVTPGEFDHLRGSFINENQGWIAKSGTLFYTENGAETFETVYNYSFEYLKKIHMVDSLHGFCNVKNNDTSYFLRTVDGGYSWEDITNDPLMVNGPLKWSTGYFFIDKDTGFYGGLNCVYKTTDSGDSWTEMIAPKPGIDPFLMGESYGIHEMFFYDGQYGWAACWFAVDGGIVLKTTNGGEDWEICEVLGILTNFWDVHFTDSLKGGAAACGMGKYVTLTEDNFNSLSYFLYNWPQETYTICYQGDSTIWVSGIPAILSRSTNSGESFSVYQTIEFPGIITPGINDIQFFGNTGYAFGNKFLLKFQDTTVVTNERNRDLSIGLKIWPVPTKNHLNLKLFSEHDDDNLQIRIYSATTGEFVLSLQEKIFHGENIMQVDLGELKKGVYFIELLGDEMVYVKKIIVR